MAATEKNREKTRMIRRNKLTAPQHKVPGFNHGERSAFRRHLQNQGVRCGANHLDGESTKILESQLI